MFKTILIHPPKRDAPIDLREVIDIGCAEAKKAFHVKRHLTVVDIIQRSYGIIVVVDVPEKSGKVVGDSSGVREGNRVH
ncbi:MAG: hypothetical protein HWN68_02315 [Desulfobacterales bacterium]|nr:hypothetical protein [Desulfobacterales bacterium]